jgi:5-methyltetrahydropteroyltriglutamate--homocysteine methyltransferase
MGMDYAAAGNQELRDITAAGIDVVQLDEPWMQTRADRAARYEVRVLNHSLEGIEAPTVYPLRLRRDGARQAGRLCLPLRAG